MKWDKVRLKDVSILIGGYAFKSSNMTDDCLPNYRPVIKIGNVSISGKLDLSSVQYHKYSNDLEGYSIKVGDVLIAMTGATVGKVSISSYNDLLLNQRVGLIRPKKDVITERYLHHALCNSVFYDYCQYTAGGGAQGNISPSQILEYSIPLPPLHIQEQIANTLDKADALRRKDQELLTKYDELAQAIFYNMFGDPVKNEKGWDVMNGNNYAERISVGVVIQPASYYVSKGIMALRSLNVRENYIDKDNMVFFSNESNNNELVKSKLKNRDVLVVRTGQPGRSAVVSEEFNDCNCIDLLIISPKHNIINSDYLSRFFNSSGGHKIVAGNETGQVQKHLNVGVLNKTDIPIPPIGLQNRFSELIKELEFQKQLANTLGGQKLFYGLMNKYFS